MPQFRAYDKQVVGGGGRGKYRFVVMIHNETTHTEGGQRLSVKAYLLALRNGIIPPESQRPTEEEQGIFIHVVPMAEAFCRKHGGDPLTMRQWAMRRYFEALEDNHQAIRDLFLEELQAEALEQLQREVEQEEATGGCPELPPEAQLSPDFARGASPWLDEYVKFSQIASPEGYAGYHRACGLWLLSTVAARRVKLQLGLDGIFPGLSIALVGRTTLHAKTTTANVAIQVLRAAGLHWLLGADETTPQKLLSNMAGQHVPANYDELPAEKQEIVRLELALAGQRGWFYDEFGQLLSEMTRATSPMANFAGLLRKLDSSPSSYRYDTKGSGREEIEAPYLAFLATLTQTDISPHAGAGAPFWRNGLWARFAFVVAPDNAVVTATFDPKPLSVPASLSTPLRRWHERLGIPYCELEPVCDKKGNLTGQYRIVREPLVTHACQITDRAYSAYVRYREALRELAMALGNQDFDGNYGRLADKALRVAMLIASLENGDVIDLPQWAVGQDFAESLRRDLHLLHWQLTAAPAVDPVEDALLGFFKRLQGKAVTVRDIKRNGPSQIRKMKPDDIKRRLDYLKENGLIEVSSPNRCVLYALATKRGE
jgi:hypothetical protein